MTSDSSNTYTYDAEGNVTKVVGPAGTSSYAYDVFNRRIHTQTPSATTEFTHDHAGRRVSSWLSPNNYGNEGRIHWDGEQTGFRSTDGTTYFDHQDTLGTERMRTNYAGAVGSSYVSLPWGDGYTATVNSSGADQDNAQFGGLERDAESGTEHAQFRNYATAQGRWLSPDPALGSYDVTNPQTFNRYPYALNNPTSFTDKAGREVCQECWGPGGGDDDDDDDDDDCGGWGGGGGGGSPTSPGTPLPHGNGPARLDPNYDPGSLGESLGIPIGMPRGNWGPLAALGLPGETECEFGACGDISDSFTNAATVPITWCAQYPKICTAGTDLEVFLQSIPTVVASVTLLAMQGDNSAAPNRCQVIIRAAQAECVEELYGGNSNGYGQAGPTLFRKCVRKKTAGSGCSY